MEIAEMELEVELERGERSEERRAKSEQDGERGDKDKRKGRVRQRRRSRTEEDGRAATRGEVLLIVTAARGQGDANAALRRCLFIMAGRAGRPASTHTHTHR
jgi:hypothetical protein